MSDPALSRDGAREVANEAEGMVVSLPQTVLSILLCRAISDNAETADDGCSEWTEREMPRLSRASVYLRSEFLRAFKAAVGTVSDDLIAAHATLKTTVEDVVRDVAALEREVSQEKLINTARAAETVLAPAVKGFLKAMFDQVVAHEKAAAQLAKDVDSGALTQIDVISRQINFIAVNAAVEAARVGEAGKGFAIIASEIKSLSEKSRHAVDRIRLALS